MSKKRKDKLKLKKLIQARLKEVQSQTPGKEKFQLTKIIHKDKKSLKLKQEISKEEIEIKPNFKKIGLIAGLLIASIITLFLINLKVQFLNPVAIKLFEIFQKS